MEQRICIVGVGGGGCRIVDCLAEDVGTAAAVAAVNTDAGALAASRASIKLQIGAGRTSGLGAGGDQNLGRMSAEDEIEMVRNLFAGAKLVFLVACLGGGTGSGATPVVLNAAREAGALTFCFAVLPFGFEGGERKAMAEHAVPVLRESADALIVLQNDRLAEATGQANMGEIFKKANRTLAEGMCGIYKMLTQQGLLNLDLADVQQMIRNSTGICTFGYGEAKGKDKARDAVKALLESPLLKQGEVVADARSLLISVVGGPDLALREVEDIRAAISAKARNDAHIFMGTVVENRWRKKVSITLIASEEWAGIPEEKPPPSTPVAETFRKPGRGRRRAKGAEEQPTLPIWESDQRRFKGVDPTILDGENYDVPTFRRRGIAIER